MATPLSGSAAVASRCLFRATLLHALQEVRNPLLDGSQGRSFPLLHGLPFPDPAHTGAARPAAAFFGPRRHAPHFKRPAAAPAVHGDWGWHREQPLQAHTFCVAMHAVDLLCWPLSNES